MANLDKLPPPDPKRLEEMLRSRRAPGVIVRGSGSIDVGPLVRPGDPRTRRAFDGGPSDAAIAADEVRQAKAFRAKKAAQRAARSKYRDGEIRHIGRMPLSTYVQARRTLPKEAFRGKEATETWRRLGAEMDE